MKRILNLFYTMWAKVLMVILILIFSWQTSVCLAQTTVLYRENETALRNVWYQWDNYDYKTSIYLQDAIKESIDIVLDYSLYYHRDIIDNSQPIVSADDNYRYITDKIGYYNDFSFAVVNHTTGRIVSNISEINYQSSGIAVRRYFSGSEANMLIVRNSHNPYYENGTITEYNDYVSYASKSFSDNFDLYIYFGEDFSFASETKNYEEIHNSILSRVKNITTMSIVYILMALVVFAILILVSGKNEAGGKNYPGLSDSLPNDMKLLLFAIVIASMTWLYGNSLYMAVRAEAYDMWPDFSAEFYVVRSYIAMGIDAIMVMLVCCTLKRQYRLGTLFTNTYIYKIFFERRDKKSE